MKPAPLALTFILGSATLAQANAAGPELQFVESGVDTPAFSSTGAWRTRLNEPAVLAVDGLPASLTFRPWTQGEYDAANDLGSAETPLALHAITFAPPLKKLGDVAPRVVVSGNPIELVADSAGQTPYIALGARAPQAQLAKFELTTNVRAGGELRILGDGNQRFQLSGRLAQTDRELSVVKTGASTLELTGSNHWTGATNVVAGTIVLREGDSIGTGALKVGGGATVRFEDLTPLAGLSRSLELAPRSKLDLNGNAWVIDYTGASPIDSIRAMLRDERIVSATEPGSTIACVESARLGRSDFAGRTIDDTCVLLTVARMGDLNLDGRIDAADLEVFSANYRKMGTWTDGDFTGDGKIDFDDMLKLSQNYDEPGKFQSDWERLRAPR